MSINLNTSIAAYIKLLSKFTDEVYIESNISDFEKLELLSNLLNSFRLIQKHIPISNLGISSVTLKKFDIESDIHSNNNRENTKDLVIYLDLGEDDYFNTIIHSLGALIYYNILNKEDEQLNKKMSSFCENILEKLLINYDELLDELVLINDNTQNLLNYLTRGKELFAKAFKNYILYSNIENYNKQTLDLSFSDYLDYKNDLTDILNLYIRHFSKDNIEKEQFSLDEIEKENILKNENRLKNKYMSKLKPNEDLDDFDYKNSDGVYLNLLELYNDSIKAMEQSFDFSFVFTNELDNSLYDAENILSIKEDVANMDSYELCTLEDELEEDIINLTNELSELEGQINIYKTKALSSKKKNTILENLIIHMFFLSQEQRTKILMKKSLESADLTYDSEHIKFSELHEKRKGAIRLIKGEPNKVKIDVYALRKKLIKIYGLSIADIKDSELRNIADSAVVNIRVSDKKSSVLKKKKVPKNKEKDVEPVSDGIYDPNDVDTKPNTLDITSAELIDTLLKRRLSTVYTNSSSKFKSKDYKRLKVSTKLTGLKIDSTKTDRLLDRLIKDTENITKTKEEKEQEQKEFDVKMNELAKDVEKVDVTIEKPTNDLEM